MEIKKIFAVLLTALGTAGLIYAATIYIKTDQVKALLVYGLLGFIFFVSGIGLVKALQDRS